MSRPKFPDDGGLKEPARPFSDTFSGAAVMQHLVEGQKPPQDFLTLYCVLNARNTALALVVAKDGADAIKVCVEDGLPWAMANCQVTRIHKRVSETRGMVDVMETAGGSGNSKNTTRQFNGGVQVEKPHRQL